LYHEDIKHHVAPLTTLINADEIDQEPLLYRLGEWVLEKICEQENLDV